MKKKMTAIAMCICILAGMITGCNASDQKKTEARTKKEITIAVNSETGGMDPAGNIALTYLSYSVTALDELLTFDENGEIEYRAAQSYEVNEDSTEWTFHLREGACWSDGTPVTSADFKNTIVRALDPKSGSGYANYLFPIEHAEEIYEGTADMESLGVETPDKNTLIFHLSKPCVYFLELLRLPVYTPSCSKYAKETGSGWDKNPETSLSNGPFYLEKYVPEQYFVLKKNERYWNADAVHLERITYRFFEEQQAMLSAYETKEVDVAVSLPSVVMELYQGKDDLVVTDNIATRYIYPNLDVKPLDDVRVREAINLAINREDLCKMVGEDTESTVNFVAKRMKNNTTGEYFVEEADPPFEENVEKARELVSRLEGRLDAKFRVGIGRVWEMEELERSYREALRALNGSLSRVIHIEDLSQNGVYDEAFPGNDEKRMFRCLEEGNEEGMLQEVNFFCDWMVEHYSQDMNNIRLKILEFIIWGEKIAFESGAINYGFSYRRDYLDTAMSLSTYEDLRKWFQEKMVNVCRAIRDQKEDQSNSAVKKAMLYIQENYSRDISLDDVSSQVNISPYYFSKIFKEETGENFIEYLTRVRIDKAKELLVDANVSVKEAGIQSGYSDPNYFSRIFKKQMDMTPSEYKARYGK